MIIGTDLDFLISKVKDFGIGLNSFGWKHQDGQIFKEEVLVLKNHPLPKKVRLNL